MAGINYIIQSKRTWTYESIVASAFKRKENKADICSWASETQGVSENLFLARFLLFASEI